MSFDKFEKLEESIEKYSKVCIDKDNNVVVNEECNRLLLHLQRNLLPKSRNSNLTNSKFENKKWLVWDLNPRVRIHQNLSLTP